MDINELAEKIISDKKFRNEVLCRYKQNCYILDKVEGSFTASVLQKMLYTSRHSRKLCAILPGMLWYSNEESISDENFQLILSYPQKIRRKLLFPVSHLRLAFSQLQTINRITGEYEAFAQLFDIICKNDSFNDIDMIYLLRDNKAGYVSEVGILACINSAQEKYGKNGKIMEAQKWVDRKSKRQE